MTREAKVVTCCPENRFYLRDGKNQNQVISSSFLSDFFTQRALYNRETLVCSEFFIRVAEVPLKNSLLPVVLFFTDSAMFCLSLLLQTLSLIFLCKNLLEILRNSISSRISLYPVGKN